MSSDDVVDKVLKACGFSELNPVQKKAIDAGLMDGSNMVVAAPTASGKTLVAEIAMLKAVLSGKKALYIVPLKALASEKYNEFKEKYEKLGFRIAMSVGDRDSSDSWLAGFDIIIVTSEKLDSLIRHDAPWIDSVGLVVADEIHLIDSPDRGPTLEVILTRLRQLINPQILALSATISNYKELADWLGAHAVKSDFRPVKLYNGLFLQGKISWHPKKPDLKLGADLPPVFEIARDTISMGKQSLVFVSTRKRAESLAEKLGDILNPSIKPDEKRELVKLSHTVSHILEHPTKQCERISRCLQRGAVFHHAGLVSKQRKLIEDNFRKGLIKMICATPTLCLHKDTRVWNGMSDHFVGDVCAKNRLFVLDGNKLRQDRPLGVNEMDVPPQMIRITTKTGKEIKLTKNHRILIRKNDERALNDAGDCKPWDKIATVGKITLDRVKSNRWSDFVKDNKLPLKDTELNPDVYYLIGLFLGDGYSGAEITDRKIIYKGSPTLVNEDRVVLEKTKAICERYNISCRHTRNKFGTSQLVLSKAKWFREFLVRCGVDVGVEKHISERLMQSDDVRLSSLLQGIFDTDGYVQKGRNIGVSSISSRLIEDLQKSLLRFGVVSRKRKRLGRSIKMHKKEYFTKDYYEILISNVECMVRFNDSIGFKVKKKAKHLSDIIDSIRRCTLMVRCKKCDYTIHPQMFLGRTKDQIKWGGQKKDVINALGKRGELKSNELKNILGFTPRKNVRRLNHHYEMIRKRKFGANEWIWGLNEIGHFIYNEILRKNEDLKCYFNDNCKCPLCGKKLEKILRKNWRGKDFDGDIFWDRIKSVECIPGENKIYDIVFPYDAAHEHLFVANGVLVHNSAGVNLPAFRVVVRDLKRFSSFRGMDYIPVLEVQQMCGRAGRPAFDSDGEAILIANSSDEAKKLWEQYILGEPEKIVSKLGVEPVLRMHVLSLIATGNGATKESLLDFFSNTFYAYQYKDLRALTGVIDNVLELLRGYGFIEYVGPASEELGDFRSASSLSSKGDEEIKPTRIGKRVAELYIDPLTANHIIESLGKMQKENKTSGISILHVVSQCLEMRPGLNIRKKDLERDDGYDSLLDFMLTYNDRLIGEIPHEWDIEYDGFLRSMKLTWMFSEWMDEVGEDALLEIFGVTPGELRARLDLSDWLFYSMQELGMLLDLQGIVRHVRKARLRVKYGIKEELLPLIKLRNIGRVRARMLFGRGLKSLQSLRNVPVTSLAQIVGPNIAKDIKRQLSGLESEKVPERQKSLG